MLHVVEVAVDLGPLVLSMPLRETHRGRLRCACFVDFMDLVSWSVVTGDNDTSPLAGMPPVGLLVVNGANVLNQEWPVCLCMLPCRCKRNLVRMGAVKVL